MEIRRGVEFDAAALAEFAARSFADAFGRDNRREDLDAHLRAAFGVAQQTRELLNPDMLTLLVQQDGALLAFAQLRRQDPPPGVIVERALELHRFYVDRPAHGTGVAQRLMAAVRDAARSMGGDWLWLGVWERNPRAITFYRKMGFLERGRKEFIVGADRQKDLVLVAPVSPP